MATAPEIEKPQVETPHVQDELDEAIVAHKTDVAHELEGLKGYLERVEETPGQVTSDDGKQPLLTPTQPQPVTITIPLTEEQIKHGLHHKIMDSVRWLAVFSLRVIKKAALLGIRVVYPVRKTEN